MILDDINYRVVREAYKKENISLSYLVDKYDTTEKEIKSILKANLPYLEWDNDFNQITITDKGKKHIKFKIIESIENREMPFSPHALNDFSKYGPRGLINYYLKKREVTTDMLLGIAGEQYILDYEEFQKNFIILDETQRPLPDKNYQTKVNKEWKDAFYEANKDKYIIDTEILEKIKEIDLQMKITNDFFIHYKAGETQVELEGEYEGLLLKGITDLLVDGERIYDLKKVQQAIFDRVKWTIINDYALQGTFYWWLEGQQSGVSFMCFDMNSNVIEVALSNQKLESELDKLKMILSRLNNAINNKAWEFGAEFIYGGRNIIF